MSLQRSIFIYLFVTRVNIINIPPCVIGSLADSVGLCQCAGAICKMKEDKLKKWRNLVFLTNLKVLDLWYIIMSCRIHRTKQDR